MREIETRIRTIPNKAGFMMETYINPMTLDAFHYSFVASLSDRLAEKAVKEIWKRHGADIIKKVDKKTVGNITVKKLFSLIAKELLEQKPKG